MAIPAPVLPHCTETYSICSVVLVVTTGKLHWKRFGFTTTQLDCAPTNVEAIAGEKAASGTTRANPSAIADPDRNRHWEGLQPTPPSTTFSTSNAISRQLNHTACLGTAAMTTWREAIAAA